MRNRFDRQLEELNEMLIHMGELARRQLRKRQEPWKGMILPEQRLSLQQTARSIRWKKKLKISA